MGKETLESLIIDLRRLNAPKDESEIRDTLQEIGVELLNKYVIVIDDIIIEPLLVEAYYYDEDKFEDLSTYGATCKECEKKQSNRFNQLFVHREDHTIYHSKGIDIVLSKGDYCLSYLIKDSLIYYNGKHEFCSQEILDARLRELLKERFERFYDIEEIDDVLKEKGEHSKYGLETTNSEGLFAKRRGTSKGDYANMELACLLLDKINNPEYNYSFEKGIGGKSGILKNHIEKNKESIINNKEEENRIRKLCSGLISQKELDDLLLNK